MTPNTTWGHSVGDGTSLWNLVEGSASFVRATLCEKPKETVGASIITFDNGWLATMLRL